MTHHTRHARCHDTVFDELECTIPFHRGVVDGWKTSILYRSHSFDPDSKAWRFWGGYQELATSILLQHVPDADLPPGRRKRQAPWSGPAHSDDFSTLHLLPSTPTALVDAAYRILARLHHHPDPDVGGDVIAIQQINGADVALKAREAL